MVSPLVVLAAGPYWGTQKFIVEDFQKLYPDSIKSTRLGWMSPNPKKHLEYPPVDAVHGGPTQAGYVECVRVELSDPDAHFKPLIEFFFLFHDSTLTRGAKDIAKASFIFCADEDQSRIATDVRQDLQAKIAARQVTCFQNAKISTKIGPATMFYPTAAEHQNYLKMFPNCKLTQKMYLNEYPAWKDGKPAAPVPVPAQTMPQKSKSKVWQAIDKKFTITAEDLAAKDQGNGPKPQKSFRDSKTWKAIDKKFTITAEDLAAKSSTSKKSSTSTKKLEVQAEKSDYVAPGVKTWLDQQNKDAESEEEKSGAFASAVSGGIASAAGLERRPSGAQKQKEEEEYVPPKSVSRWLEQQA